MTKSKIDLLHIGLHKTATTFLQKEVFPKIKDKTIISNESYSGTPCSNAFGLHYRYAMIEEIHRLYGDVPILLVLRSKESWKKSCYFQYIKKGGYYTFDEWSKYVFDPELLNFEKYISLLKQRFTKVYVLHYESLHISQWYFITALSYYIGCTPPDVEFKVHNKSYNGILLTLHRLVNKFMNNYYPYIINKMIT